MFAILTIGYNSINNTVSSEILSEIPTSNKEVSGPNTLAFDT